MKTAKRNLGLNFKLKPALVPKSLWGISASEFLGRSAWQRIRRDALEQCQGACEFCGTQPSPLYGDPLHCHEIWQYDDKKRTATLVGFKMQCQACSTATHIGRSMALGLPTIVGLAALAVVTWFVWKRRTKRRRPVTVHNEIERATALGRRLQDLLVGKQLTLGMTAQKTPDRDKLLGGYWALVVGYHEGMLGLMKQKLYSSAFALLRPTMEALIRAHVILFAPQQVVDEIVTDKYSTKFGTVGAEIDAAFGYKRPGASAGLFERFLKDENVLHSFTHSGMPQLGRRFNGADLEVNFDDEEVTNFLSISTAALALTTILLTNQFGLKVEAKEANRLFLDWGDTEAAAASR